MGEEGQHTVNVVSLKINHPAVNKRRDLQKSYVFYLFTIMEMFANTLAFKWKDSTQRSLIDMWMKDVPAF